MGRIRGFAAVSALALAWGTAVAIPAEAAILGCGDIVVRNTTLENDVGPCGVGLVIGADNITLDLNGYSITGLPRTDDGAGIYLLRRTNVTVKNGTVRNFDGGVVLDGGTQNTVRNMDVHDNIGVVGQTRYAEGIALLSSTNNRIIGNRVRHNGPLGGIGLYSRVDINHPRQTSGLTTGNLIDSNQVLDNNIERNAGLNDS
ncbi:MAG: right-handed parallel beta-helix repeat-containing protein, partial [Acidimicrobiales bacterium]